MAGPCTDRGLGIYISVPFCRAKCTYCNFASGVFGEARLGEYVSHLCAEIRRARSRVPADAELPGLVDSVYLGGGTPSLLSAPQVGAIFAALRAAFALAPGAEITLECAPGQLTDETLDELLRQGMNRISLGVQSFVDREARAVGRLHTRETCLAEIARLRAAGLANLNVDLIAGLPGQTRESWLASLEELIATGVPHASVYMLEVDDGSRLGREVLAAGGRYGAASVPDDAETTEWYALACDRLAAAGIPQYEISNFSRPGLRSRHNVKYWQRDPYLGFGLDAHSMLRLPGSPQAIRWANPDELSGYEDSAVSDPESRIASGTEHSGLRILPQGGPAVERIGLAESFEEAIFLGLRTNDGVDLAELEAEFGRDGTDLVARATATLRELAEGGLLELAGNRIGLTARGRVVSNEVFERILTGSPAGQGTAVGA